MMVLCLGLFCRILSLLWGSFAKETCDLIVFCLTAVDGGDCAETAAAAACRSANGADALTHTIALSICVCIYLYMYVYVYACVYIYNVAAAAVGAQRALMFLPIPLR